MVNLQLAKLPALNYRPTPILIQVLRSQYDTYSNHPQHSACALCSCDIPAFAFLLINRLRAPLSVSNHPHITCCAGQHCQTIILPASLALETFPVTCTVSKVYVRSSTKYHALVEESVGVAGPEGVGAACCTDSDIRRLHWPHSVHPNWGPGFNACNHLQWVNISSVAH